MAFSCETRHIDTRARKTVKHTGIWERQEKLSGGKWRLGGGEKLRESLFCSFVCVCFVRNWATEKFLL